MSSNTAPLASDPVQAGCLNTSLLQDVKKHYERKHEAEAERITPAPVPECNCQVPVSVNQTQTLSPVYSGSLGIAKRSVVPTACVCIRHLASLLFESATADSLLYYRMEGDNLKDASSVSNLQARPYNLNRPQGALTMNQQVSSPTTTPQTLVSDFRTKGSSGP